MSQTPAIAIKTAQELLAADRKDAALQILNESLTAKKNKQWQPEMEVLITLLLDVCIKTANFKMAKDALHQYRSVCQTQAQNLLSLEKVLLEFLSKVDAMVKEANESATKTVAKTLSEAESIESIILRTVSGDDLSERTKKLAVNPSQKFMWESYRAVLDLIRNKPKLEGLYHKTAVAVMNFCVSSERKQDFRRIGDLLRGHWNQLESGVAPNNLATVLSGSVSIQYLFSVRFEYLNFAIKLELWQEAFKTVEDISGICAVIKRQPPPQMLANYYEKLAQLFWVSRNYVFHAYAWLRFYILSKNQNRNLSENDLQKMASLVLVSALAVPIESPQLNDQYFEYNIQKEKNTHLTALLGLSSNLRRDNLLKEIVAHAIPSVVNPELRGIFHLIEEKFHPLELSKSLEKTFQFIQEQPSLSRYSRLIRKVAFTRQLQQLSRVYQTMTLSSLGQLAPLASPDAIEKLVVKCAYLNLISARIDHQLQRICFVTDALESGTIKNQLCIIYEKLNQAVNLVQPDRENERQARKVEFLRTVVKHSDEQYEANIERLDLIEEEKYREETIEKLKAQLAEKKKKLQLAKAAVAAVEAPPEPAKENVPPPSAVSADAVLEKQREEKIKQEKTLKEKLISLTYKMDYLERARREVEAPLLRKWFKKVSKDDANRHQQTVESQLRLHRETHTRELAEKQRLAKVLEEKVRFESQKLEGYSARVEQITKHNEEIQKQIEQEQERLKEELRLRRKEEAAERERRRAEEEAAKQAELKRQAEEKERAETAAKQTREAAATQNTAPRWGAKKDTPSSTPVREPESAPAESRPVWGAKKGTTPSTSSWGNRTRTEDRPREESSQRYEAPSERRQDPPSDRPTWGSRTRQTDDRPRQDDRPRFEAPSERRRTDAPRDGPRDYRRDDAPRDGPRDYQRRDDGPRDYPRRDDGPRDGPRDYQRRDDGPRTPDSRAVPESRADAAPKWGRRSDAPRSDAPREPRRDDSSSRRDDGPRDAPRESSSRRDDGPREPRRDDSSSRRDDGPREPRRETNTPSDRPTWKRRDDKEEAPRTAWKKDSQSTPSEQTKWRSKRQEPSAAPAPKKQAAQEPAADDDGFTVVKKGKR